MKKARPDPDLTTSMARYRRAVNYLAAAQKVAARHPEAGARAEALIVEYERRISDHHRYIQIHGVDQPEIANWK